jgi:hypothetical protein
MRIIFWGYDPQGPAFQRLVITGFIFAGLDHDGHGTVCHGRDPLLMPVRAFECHSMPVSTIPVFTSSYVNIAPKCSSGDFALEGSNGRPGCLLTLGLRPDHCSQAPASRPAIFPLSDLAAVRAAPLVPETWRSLHRRISPVAAR